jgi:phage shock protein C
MLVVEGDMYCNFCGKMIQEDARICAYCGRVVVGSVTVKRLERSRVDRKIGGVCAGFGKYFDLDVALVRILWILAVIFTIPFAVVAYIIAWIVMPEEPEYLVYPHPAVVQNASPSA